MARESERILKFHHFQQLINATMSDELAEIDGIKPKVLLHEGDEKELGSKSRWVHRSGREKMVSLNGSGM